VRPRFNWRATQLAHLLLAHDCMNKKLMRAILVVLCLSVVSLGQARRQVGPSLEARARALQPLISDSARRYGIDPRLLEMICFVESRFRAEVVSPKGARGLMQFMPETAARYGLKNPHHPKQAIEAAARYLRDLLERFGGRLDLAVAGYNAGEGAVESFRTGRPLLLRTGKVINPRGMITGGIPPYRETQSYVNQILTSLVSRRRTTPSLPQRREAVRRNDFTLDTDSFRTSDELKGRRIINSSFIEIKDPF